MEDSFFKKLSPEEEIQFRSWARENYIPGGEISSLWHPVVREECDLINQEKGVKHED